MRPYYLVHEPTLQLGFVQYNFGQVRTTNALRIATQRSASVRDGRGGSVMMVVVIRGGAVNAVNDALFSALLSLTSVVG